MVWGAAILAFETGFIHVAVLLLWVGWRIVARRLRKTATTAIVGYPGGTWWGVGDTWYGGDGGELATHGMAGSNLAM